MAIVAIVALYLKCGTMRKCLGNMKQSLEGTILRLVVPRPLPRRTEKYKYPDGSEYLTLKEANQHGVNCKKTKWKQDSSMHCMQ